MYSEYQLPSSWYENDLEIESCCHKCEEKELTFDNAQDYLKEVVQQLYSKEDLDLARFEDILDNLCHLFQLKLPETLPNIERKKDANLVTDWLQFNNKYFKQLA